MRKEKSGAAEEFSLYKEFCISDPEASFPPEVVEPEKRVAEI